MYHLLLFVSLFRWDAIKNVVAFKTNTLTTQSLQDTSVQERAVVVFHGNIRVPKQHALTFHLSSLRSQDTDLQYPNNNQHSGEYANITLSISLRQPGLEGENKASTASFVWENIF